MKNQLIDLNNHLFEQMERLNDDSLKGDELNVEILRSKAMGELAVKIIDNARLALDGQKALYDKVRKLPQMINNGETADVAE